MVKSLSYENLQKYQKAGAERPKIGDNKHISWKVIAVKKDPRNFWIPTENCPFLDHRNTKEKVRFAAEQGNLIIAQKKLGPFHYELWATEPKIKAQHLSTI